MSDKTAQGFLEHILAHPEDDAPRLVFADWLEEHGDGDRAEFIRVQIARARLPGWDARQVPLRLRERALLQQCRLKWQRKLPYIGGMTWRDYRRGFRATADFSDFSELKKNAGICWALAPLEAISVRFCRGQESAENIEPIAGLRELFINNERFYDLEEIASLAAAPLLSTLRALNVHACNLGVEGFQRLIASPHLGNLTALRVPENHIGNGGISALFDAASLTSLEVLDLSERNSYGRYNENPLIEAIGAAALASWPGLSKLRSLTLSSNAVGREGLRALLRSPRAAGLKELALRDNGLDGSAMQEFGAAHSALQLEVLDLGSNVLKDLGAAELARAPCLRELKVLELDRCEIALSGARRLARAPFLARLRHLNVDHNSFGPDGLFALLEAKPQELHTLRMVNNDLGDEGVSRLAESPASDTLLEVNLAQNKWELHGVEALGRAKHLQNLFILRLHGNLIAGSAAKLLRKSPLGRRLTILEKDQTTEGEDIPF